MSGQTTVQNYSRMMPILLALGFLVMVEARGKGGAANGGGNSWRGGKAEDIIRLIFSQFSSSCRLPPQSRGSGANSQLGRLGNIFYIKFYQHDHHQQSGDGAALWTWIIIAVISTLVLGALICLFFKTFTSCKVNLKPALSFINKKIEDFYLL